MNGLALKILIGLSITLGASGVLGGLKVWSDLAVLEEKNRAVVERLERIESKLDKVTDLLLDGFRN